MLHFQILKKYTVGLLNAFSKIQIPKYNIDGKIEKLINVPILFGNRDKAYKINNSNENLTSGNNYTIPRMALSFNTMTKAPQRDTSKHTKINLPSKTNKNQRVEFQFNSVAYDFQFTLHIATRTLSDMMMIIESIAPKFRPTYTMPIYEVEIQPEPTSIIVELVSVDIELPEDIENEELRIVKCQMPLNVRGNLYLPITNEALITKIRMYIDESLESDLQYSLAFYNFEIDNSGVINEYYNDNHDFITKVKENEGNKGW